MRRNNLFFHPLSVFAFAVVAICCYAAWMRWRVPDGDLSRHYIYVLPIIIPLVAFLFDRARSFRNVTRFELFTDLIVIGAAMMRMIGYVPMVSGHTLFLSYAIAARSSRLTRVAAILVLAQVVYLKLFVWHDFITPLIGIFVGLIAALNTRWFGAKALPSSRMTPIRGIE